MLFSQPPLSLSTPHWLSAPHSTSATAPKIPFPTEPSSLVSMEGTFTLGSPPESLPLGSSPQQGGEGLVRGLQLVKEVGWPRLKEAEQGRATSTGVE